MKCKSLLITLIVVSSLVSCATLTGKGTGKEVDTIIVKVPMIPNDVSYRLNSIEKENHLLRVEIDRLKKEREQLKTKMKVMTKINQLSKELKEIKR